MRIWNNYNRNATDPQFLSLGNQLNALVPNPFFGKIAIGTMSTATVRQGLLLVPYQQYAGSINQIRASVGDSSYHGFTLRVERSFSKGLLFQASFTGAKLIDNVNERFLGGANFVNPITWACRGPFLRLMSTGAWSPTLFGNCLSVGGSASCRMVSAA